MGKDGEVSPRELGGLVNSFYVKDVLFSARIVLLEDMLFVQGAVENI